MTRDEVLEHIHKYAQWTSRVEDDGCRSSGPSSYKQYLGKFEEGMRDLLRGDGLVPAAEVLVGRVYVKYANQGLWSDDDLLNSCDLRVVRDIEYDIARRKDKKARDAYWAKWDAIELPGDEVIR